MHIEHTCTRARSPQTNGICERFHKTILQEFYQVTFRKHIYTDLESLQADLDSWLAYYNNERTHQGKMCCGRTPMATWEDGKQIWKESSSPELDLTATASSEPVTVRSDRDYYI